MDNVYLVDSIKRTISGDSWRIRVEWLYAREGYWVALAGVRAGLSLLLEGYYDGSEIDSPFHGRGQIYLEAWEGHPEETNGVAVWGPDEPIAIVEIPLCGCGDRGCGNAGRQFTGDVRPNRIFEVFDLLRRLPWSPEVPSWEQAIGTRDLKGLLWGPQEQPAQASGNQPVSGRGRAVRSKETSPVRWGLALLSSEDPRSIASRREGEIKAEALAAFRPGRRPGPPCL